MTHELDIQEEMLHILRCMEEHLSVLRKEVDDVREARERETEEMRKIREEIRNGW